MSTTGIKNFKWKTNAAGVTITKYTGDETYVVIPEKIGRKPVKEIGPFAFVRCSKLTNVILPEGLIGIVEGLVVGVEAGLAIVGCHKVAAAVTGRCKAALPRCRNAGILCPRAFTSNVVVRICVLMHNESAELRGLFATVWASDFCTSLTGCLSCGSSVRGSLPAATSIF